MVTASQTRSNNAPDNAWEMIIGSENLLILALRPGDESLACGGLVARCCRHGRAPFVVILTDGSTTSASPYLHSPDDLALLHERETRLAVQCLGLPAKRLLMAGLFDGAVPNDGPGFDAVVRGITLVMWARDCNIICAPALYDPAPDQIAANRIAVEVAKTSGVGLLFYDTPQPPPAVEPQDASSSGRRLDITLDWPAKLAAIAAHASRFGEMCHDPDARRHEVLRLGALPRSL